MIESGRYTSGWIAIANLSSTIEGLRLGPGTFAGLAVLSRLLFLRGDLLGCIADHDEAEQRAAEAVAGAPDAREALYLRAQVAERFHRFSDASALIAEARAAGLPAQELDAAHAGVLQATGCYDQALALRQRLAAEAPGFHALAALGSLLADMDRWDAAESCYRAAIDADEGVSPILQPGAVRVGCASDASWRPRSCRDAVRGGRRDPAAARARARASRGGGTRAR